MLAQSSHAVGMVLPTCAPRLPIKLCNLLPRRWSGNWQPDISSATHSLPTSILSLSADRSRAPVDVTSAPWGDDPLLSSAPHV